MARTSHAKMETPWAKEVEKVTQHIEAKDGM